MSKGNVSHRDRVRSRVSMGDDVGHDGLSIVKTIFRAKPYQPRK